MKLEKKLSEQEAKRIAKATEWEAKLEKVNKEFESFFWNLLPSMQVQDSHIVRLVSILQDTPDTDHIF